MAPRFTAIVGTSILYCVKTDSLFILSKGKGGYQNTNILDTIYYILTQYTSIPKFHFQAMSVCLSVCLSTYCNPG